MIISQVAAQSPYSIWLILIDRVQPSLIAGVILYVRDTHLRLWLEFACEMYLLVKCTSQVRERQVSVNTYLENDS